MTKFHKVQVDKLAKLVDYYGKPMYAIDVNRWGISEAFSDPENHTIYRETKYQLAKDTFVGEDIDLDHTHYPEARYGSIFDY
jgi:hypothetical protein